MHGLEEVKVLELGTLVSAAYATKIMADLGADVIKVEEPEGNQARRRGPFPHGSTDPEQSGLFLALNTNKRGCTYDLMRDKATLRRLVAWADMLVHNYSPAPVRGQDTDHVMRDVLGYSAQQIAHLKDEQVLY